MNNDVSIRYVDGYEGLRKLLSSRSDDVVSFRLFFTLEFAGVKTSVSSKEYSLAEISKELFRVEKVFNKSNVAPKIGGEFKITPYAIFRFNNSRTQKFKLADTMTDICMYESKEELECFLLAIGIVGFLAMTFITYYAFGFFG